MREAAHPRLDEAPITAAPSQCQWCSGTVTAADGPCPLAFICPSCDARAGSWCSRPSGHRAMMLHLSRRQLARPRWDQLELELEGQS